METTINMNVIILKKLNTISEKTDKSRGSIIKQCLKELEKNSLSKIKLYSTVKYQSSDIQVNWSKFHLVLTPEEYEFFIDMRNFFKMSLSLLIAFSILKYEDLIINRFENGDFTDKYLFPVYQFSYEVISGVKCFLISWGKPKNKIKIIEKEKFMSY